MKTIETEISNHKVIGGLARVMNGHSTIRRTLLKTAVSRRGEVPPQLAICA